MKTTGITLLRILRGQIPAVLAAVIVVAATASVSLAVDRIRETSGIGHTGQIIGLKSKGIAFREQSGDTKEIPLANIGAISSDQFPNLAPAEAAYAKGIAGDAASLAKAEPFYKSTIESSSAPQWLRLLSQSRMYAAFVGRGQVMEAVNSYLQLATADPGLVSGLKLPSPTPGAADNPQILQKVDAAIRSGGDKSYVAELKNLQLALVSLSGKPEAVLEALESRIKSSDDRVRIPAMFERINVLFTLNRGSDAVTQYDEVSAIADPVEYGADLAYWKGRVARFKNQHLEAALEFMRVAIQYPNKNPTRTAESLFYAGQALEAAKATKPEIRKVYQEAVDKYPTTPGAEQARTALTKLGA
jgi:tetratricopeptide (TPR) repeat protein